LRQLNVTGGSPGTTIGTCGANIAGAVYGGNNVTAGQGAVSEDGSSIFFEAIPGKNCAEPKDLYVRVNGSQENAQTVDIGTYRFIAANADGSHALIEKSAGENPGLYLYTAESKSAKFLPSSGIATGANLTVSEDLSTVYIRNAGSESYIPDLYRYDVATEKLSFITHLALTGTQVFDTSPEGRYLYFVAETVAGLPGGGIEPEVPHAATQGQTTQVYRYDSTEQVIQCMSCASPYDPEPKLSALFTEGGGTRFASTNGDYVFFDTPAALVSSDVDGEIPPEGLKGSGGEHASDNYSLSSDVYEWRRDGLDGCTALQGCLALITSGGGGFLNILLGTTPSGNDVFFATNESLLPSDKDTAGDIYDARVFGGFGEPANAASCEGDACSTPYAPPGEITPSSATFQGTGNTTTPTTKKPTNTKPKPSCKAKSKKKCAKPKATKKHTKTKHAKRTGKTTRRPSK
jgi:hypothetical protein